MRITHKTIFETNQYDLARKLEELAAANKVVTIGKRINSLSDDPVGLSQVLDLKSNIENLDQLTRNITTGRTWLNASETAFSSLSDQLSEALVISEQQATGTYTAEQRENAASRVDGILRQIITYGNTQVNGQYIFSGSMTKTLPFDLDDTMNPTAVNYFGNDETFSIKTGKDMRVTVGNDGEDALRYSEITVDSSNNVIQFIEYTRGAASQEITAEIPHGTYSRDELATAMRNAMNVASGETGGGINYKVDYDATQEQYIIQDEGSRSGVHTELMFGTGSRNGNSIAPYIGFDLVDTRDAVLSDTTVPTFPLTINPGNGSIVFSEDNGTGAARITIDIAGVYNTAADLANALELAMDAGSSANGYSINYEVLYDTNNQQFVIEEEDGTDLKQMQILQNGSSSSALSALGMTETDHNYQKPTSTDKVDWSIFKSIIDLKNYLGSDDSDGIARSMTIIRTHLRKIESRVAEVGSNIIRLDVRENVISELKLSYTDRQAKLEDADMVDAVSNLKLKEFAYQASLAATAKVMSMSLADYL